eukprot:CAMPEP_0114328130 /NCGR_PEP_ID=MMETSP0101-20121206/206_1 /TAXON_ID=38822 ORGANISM="Pteridomonas danica, Strain PT" /NCGR_SAMPLE_ID=MMETSP0101 /ASSEMBLY_ACC=CAM_ASM_000211 /LENGTH=202 /DNA_ID=CAMNT_0001457359 /DNA_START=638 /DNA_END=1246 /DNA_ORIENTATION=-
MGVEVNENDPVLKIEALRLQGILTDEEARSKISLIQAQVDQAMIDNSAKSAASLRNRLFGQNKNGMKNTSMSESVHSTSSQQQSSHAQTGGGVGGMSTLDISSPGIPENESEDIFSGMLIRDGKLQRFVLNHQGTLIQTSLGGNGKSKEWRLAGERVVVTLEAKPNTFMVAFGKNKIKLGANSEAEMMGWMEALARAAYMSA